MGEWAKGRVGEGVGAREWRAWGVEKRSSDPESPATAFPERYVKAEAARQPASIAPSR